MPANKLKLIYLQKIFLEQTDENHKLTANQLIARLAQHEVFVERKSLYSDIETLKNFGMDIVCEKEKSTGYYLASRDFELAELKLLVDAVQSSKFITHRKSSELIKKIEGLCSAHEAQLLQRQVYVTNRIKTMNESIYYNVDAIHNGIGSGKKISFQYFEYTVEKKRKLRKNGERYLVSPMALTWDDENYYLLAFDSAAGIIKHYRVDKMTDILVTGEKREGLEIFQQIDMAQYAKRVFGMFAGQAESVRLKFENSLVGVVLDRFGKDVMIVTADESHFSIPVTVEISPQFFGWLAGLGDQVEILSPKNVREKYALHIEKIRMSLQGEALDTCGLERKIEEIQ